MTVPYTPSAFSTPIINPSVGGAGLPPLPYISNSMYAFAPTAINANDLYPGGTQAQQNQALADTINRASRWADNICFGSDPAGKGASLAASLSVESVSTNIKGGELRLVCDYRPILEVVGMDVGPNPSSLSALAPAQVSMIEIKRRTIVLPWGWAPVQGRPYDTGPYLPQNGGGRIYAVWSYVNGYPHTELVDGVAQGATSCVVTSTDGAGGVYGVYPASGTFPGTALTFYDEGNTETVYVQDITTGTSTTTLTVSAFANAHTVPAAPDFIPVSAIPADVHEAVILLTSMLIKTRGVRSLTMPQLPITRPERSTTQALAQAGALEDFDIACHLLAPYTIRTKAKT